MSPEAKARQVIDKKLVESGYVLQDMGGFDPSAGMGVVIREYPTNSGPVDYLIFIDKKPVGVIEAKASNKGEVLTTVAEQSKRYAEGGLKYLSTMPQIKFAYEATDIITHFCNYTDEKYRSREVYTFHRPETLLNWINDEETLRNRLKHFPEFDNTGFRECQTQAIINLEKSFGDNKPKALIQMATGAGKTFTAITTVYRLLKYANASRVLFLVDTKNLGEQAEAEFNNYKPTDDARRFPELYNVRRLNSSYIPQDTHVCISTIQRMYSILREEEMDESFEETSMNEQRLSGRPKEIVYNEKYPVEFFDFVIIDECHRSIYNVWQQVLDYFDAFLIGLTATPDKRTFGFFNENVVSEYTHEQAVLDGVNVGGDVFLIETDITKKGGCIATRYIEKRDRKTRQKRWEESDEPISYSPTQLDRDVVNPSQIRNVIKAFKDKVLTEMFQGRKEIPKTLVFAKTDSHADDIIKIIREEFGEGNNFCKKITYQAIEDPRSVLAEFRNEYNPRIAVTVDMIATGTDVKPLECLLFMRDVKSKNYFEQMKGRGTRTLDFESLHKVTPSATQLKTGYVLVDAIGVTKSLKTDSRPLERKPTVSLKDLMMSVAIGQHDVDTLTSLANRFIKLDMVLTNKEKEKLQELSDGVSANDMARNMLNAFDEDLIVKKAIEKYKVVNDEEITSEQKQEVQEELIADAVAPIYKADLRKYIEEIRKVHDQVIDNTNIDYVVFADWSTAHEEKAEKVIETFRNFIEKNKNEITALNIIYNQSYRNRPLTLDMVTELYEVLKKAPYGLSNDILWRAYSVIIPDHVKDKSVFHKLVDIVSLIKFELGQTEDLNMYSVEVNSKFKKWIFEKNAGNGQFTEDQMEWLRMIRDHIAVSMQITKDDLEYTPFDGKGGLGKFYLLFGNKYEEVLEEINIALAA
ncbi:MAG: type I restriction-modification enzyme R subunit C-terminal domain-containing protein [Mobilitalea sp.]